jgi:disulfide bond formation protein DsbB
VTAAHPDHLAQAARLGVVVGGLSVAALLVAFLLQYGFGVEPCNLCIWERWPYAFAILATLGGTALGRPRLGLALTGLALLANAGLAAYHVGVEEGLFALPEGCTTSGQASSIEELRAQLAAAPARCDQVSVIWLGLSLAAWNGLYAGALGLLALAGAFLPLGGLSQAHARR